MVDTAGSSLAASDGRFVFHGSVEIRALRASQRDQSRSIQEDVSQAPVQLTATGVDVEITRTP